MSAYGCEPFRGSEAGVGWNWVLQMARFNELYVIARENDRAKIEDNLPKECRGTVHFYYYDTCHAIMKLKKKEKGLYLYYWLWQIGIIPLVARIIREKKPDYTMHLTFGSLWMPTFLPFFKVPFIWGPVGGGDGVPTAYLKRLPIKQRVVQAFRYVLINLSWANPLVYIPSKSAIAIIGRTKNNIMAIPKKYRAKGRVILETAMGNEAFLNFEKSEKLTNIIHLISTGRLVPFKNISMAIEVIKRVIEDNYDIHYTIIGNGPEENHIESLVKNYGIEDKVTLLGELPREEVLKKLRDADIYVFPSLREGGSWALMEAMAAGLPTVCFDWTGTGVITDDTCAERITPTSPEVDIDKFVKAIENLIDDPKKREQFGIRAQNRIRETFNWEEKGRFMNCLFDELEGK